MEVKCKGGLIDMCPGKEDYQNGFYLKAIAYKLDEISKKLESKNYACWCYDNMDGDEPCKTYCDNAYNSWSQKTSKEKGLYKNA